MRFVQWICKTQHRIFKIETSRWFEFMKNWLRSMRFVQWICKMQHRIFKMQTLRWFEFMYVLCTMPYSLRSAAHPSLSNRNQNGGWEYLRLQCSIDTFRILKCSLTPREFYLTWTLPKCISFLRMSSKEKAVSSKIFGVVGYESSRNLKTQNGSSNMAISHTIFQWVVDSFAVIDLKTFTSSFWSCWWRFWSQILQITNGGSSMADTYSKFN